MTVTREELLQLAIDADLIRPRLGEIARRAGLSEAGARRAFQDPAQVSRLTLTRIVTALRAAVQERAA